MAQSWSADKFSTTWNFPMVRIGDKPISIKQASLNDPPKELFTIHQDSDGLRFSIPEKEFKPSRAEVLEITKVLVEWLSLSSEDFHVPPSKP